MREGGGDFSASSPMGCSMMHEIWLGKVTSCHMIRAIYQKAEKGGFSANLYQVEVLPVEAQ